MIGTWISDYEIPNLSKVDDKELNDLFQEVRKEFDNKILIQETISYTRNFFGKKTSFTMYTVYYLHSNMDAQIVNFPQDRDWSINTMVPKSYVMTYFLGLLSGKNINEYGKSKNDSI
jgi:hypothetical protein